VLQLFRQASDPLTVAGGAAGLDASTFGAHSLWAGYTNECEVCARPHRQTVSKTTHFPTIKI
jgi:hypothetical protein